MLQLREHFIYKNEKDLDTCNKKWYDGYDPNTKRAYFKTGIIDNSKAFEDGKTQNCSHKMHNQRKNCDTDSTNQ